MRSCLPLFYSNVAFVANKVRPSIQGGPNQIMDSPTLIYASCQISWGNNASRHDNIIFQFLLVIFAACLVNPKHEILPYKSNERLKAALIEVCWTALSFLSETFEAANDAGAVPSLNLGTFFTNSVMAIWFIRWRSEIYFNKAKKSSTCVHTAKTIEGFSKASCISTSGAIIIHYRMEMAVEAILLFCSFSFCFRATGGKN